VLKGNWDWDRKRRPARKWKNRQLGQRIKWTGPSTAQPEDLLYAIAPTQAAKDEHQRAWDEAYRKCFEEQLRKLPLLAQEYGIDTRADAWPIRLLLFLAEKEAPGLRIDWRGRPGPSPTTWTDSTWAALRADIEVEKRELKEQGLRATDKKACRVLVSAPKYRRRYGKIGRGRSIELRAKLLNNQLVYARNSKGMVAKLMKKWPAISSGIDSLISAYALDLNARVAAEERITARYASYADRVAASGTSSRSTRRK
jgi:hypothetical protein